MLPGAQHSQPQPKDAPSHKVASEEGNWPLCAFPQTDVIRKARLLTAENNTLHAIPPCSPHTEYRQCWSKSHRWVTEKTATLKPDLVHKQKIKRPNHSGLPSKSLKKLGSIMSSSGSRELRYKEIRHLVSLTLLGS